LRFFSLFLGLNTRACAFFIHLLFFFFFENILNFYISLHFLFLLSDGRGINQGKKREKRGILSFATYPARAFLYARTQPHALLLEKRRLCSRFGEVGALRRSNILGTFPHAFVFATYRVDLV
jgi:hypothetical protein